MADTSFQIDTTNGNCFSAWSPPETVENAHDNGTPQVVKGTVSTNATGGPSPAPVADR